MQLSKIRTILEQIRWEAVADEYELTHGTDHPELKEVMDRIPEFIIPSIRIEADDETTPEEFAVAEQNIREEVAAQRQLQIDAIEIVLELLQEAEETDEVVYHVGDTANP